MDIDRAILEHRVQLYFDPGTDWETLKALGTGLTENAAGYETKKVRLKVQAVKTFQADRICRYALRPFDNRWCYYSEVSPLWNRSRPALWEQCWPGNSFLLSRVKGVKTPEGVPFYYARGLSDDHLLADDAFCFPIRLKAVSQKGKAQNGQNELFETEAPASSTPTANLSPAARSYLASLGLPDPDADPETASLIWFHALAVGYAPAYLTENADGIRQDWPRVPLPDSGEALENSARLGRELAALLDPETPVAGVTAGVIRPELKILAVISKVGGGTLNPDVGDLALTVGWGHGGKDGITMPGKGKVITRDYTPEELADIREGAGALGLTPEQALEHLGRTTCDVYLNESAFWCNIPSRVWGYYIGGYQVIKKWLSYRERDLLGRPLTMAEVREVTNMARRLAAIVLMEPTLNANYQAVKESCFPWPQAKPQP
ncbi:MAG: hypothetical protein M0P73_15625 [Syntrophobacterales bacterium]|nr:hypothetical protein [Syntrophobacterales bacterium]